MPAFHNHAIFADKFYLDNLKDEKIFKEECNLESLKTYSLGPDLLAFSSLPFDSHNLKTKEFLLKLIKNVKDNNLKSDSNVLALLYGHILHYFLDINMHPYIYYHEQGMESAKITLPGLTDTHTIFEGYLSYYFIKEVKNLHIVCLYPQYYSSGDLKDQNCINILNSTYEDVYGAKKINKEYNKNLFMLTTVEDIIRTKLFNIDKVKKMFGYTRLVNLYGLNGDDFHNESNKEWYHPVTGEKHNESAKELFDKALEDSCYAISDVNEYLYGKKDLSELEKIFTDLSYDTGLPCSIPKEFKYYKNYEKKI